jgi:NADH-quinone oxidoreductase subunit L
MWVGSLALAGIGIPGTPLGFSGFFSKDVIIEAAYGAHSGPGTFAFWIGVVAAFLTAFYSWRLILMTFHGKPRMDQETWAHVHESPRVMIWPLYVLGAGAIFGGLLAYGALVGDDRAAFWGESLLVLPANDSIEAAHHAPIWVKWAPLIVALAGIGLAYVMYLLWPGLPAVLARVFRPIYLFLLNKWYFDELYDAIFVRPAHAIGRGLWKQGDGAVIDGYGPDGIAATTVSLAQRVSRLQTGYVYHYAFAMLIGVVVLVSWYILSGLG